MSNLSRASYSYKLVTVASTSRSGRFDHHPAFTLEAVGLPTAFRQKAGHHSGTWAPSNSALGGRAAPKGDLSREGDEPSPSESLLPSSLALCAGRGWWPWWCLWSTAHLRTYIYKRWFGPLGAPRSTPLLSHGPPTHHMHLILISPNAQENHLCAHTCVHTTTYSILGLV
jgi:hypothetical protein